MSQVELVWGAFSLMFLGALVSMCMKCQQAGNKQEKASFNNQRNQCESQWRVEVVCSHSTSRQEHMKMPQDMRRPGKSNEHLSTANYHGTYTEPRYQNCGKETQMEPEAAYVEPIPANPYYNCRKSTRPSSEDDSPSYQNLAGPASTSGCIFVDMGVYENGEEIQLWKHAQIDENDYEDEEEESDYINALHSRVPA